MNHWLPWSLAATLFLGVSMSLYKLPSYKGYSSYFSTFWTNVVAWLLVLLALALVPAARPAALAVSWYALLWGALFATTMVLQKLMLARVETGAAYSVTSSLGSLLTVIIGLTALGERLSPLQGAGIVTVLFAVFLFTRKDGGFPRDRVVYLLALGVLAASTASKYVQKLGATHETTAQFMVWQYLGAALFALALAAVMERRRFGELFHLHRYWRGSVLIGLFTALGGYAIFHALAIGPLSGVYAIHPSYTIVAALLGAALFRERLTRRKLALAALSAVGIVLIKIG